MIKYLHLPMFIKQILFIRVTLHMSMYNLQVLGEVKI